MYHFYFHIYILHHFKTEYLWKKCGGFFQVKATHHVPHSPFACHLKMTCTGERLACRQSLFPISLLLLGQPVVFLSSSPGKERCLQVPSLQSQCKACFIAPSYTLSPSCSAGRDWGFLEGWRREGAVKHHALWYCEEGKEEPELIMCFQVHV